MPEIKSSRPASTGQAAIRKDKRMARASMCTSERDTASAKITQTVMRTSWFRSAATLACYLPMHDEVDTWPIITRAWAMKKRVFVPVIEKNFGMRFREISPESDLYSSQLGFAAPSDGKLISPRALDLVITPLVAFDRERNRIGMGGGYYDRTFAFLRHRKHLLRPKLIGVAFACQQVPEIAANPWDIRLFRVIRESS